VAPAYPADRYDGRCPGAWRPLRVRGPAAPRALGNPSGANVFPGVPAEFTNWRDEQRAWQETCVLFTSRTT
jgi:hypothetical protein